MATLAAAFSAVSPGSVSERANSRIAVRARSAFSNCSGVRAVVVYSFVARLKGDR